MAKLVLRRGRGGKRQQILLRRSTAGGLRGQEGSPARKPPGKVLRRYGFWVDNVMGLGTRLGLSIAFLEEKRRRRGGGVHNSRSVRIKTAGLDGPAKQPATRDMRSCALCNGKETRTRADAATRGLAADKAKDAGGGGGRCGFEVVAFGGQSVKG